MKTKLIVAAVVSSFALVAAPAMADHHFKDVCKKEAAAAKVAKKDMGAFMKKCEADKKAAKKAAAPKAEAPAAK